MYFNWRIINLQYCGGLAIHQHESAMSAQLSLHPEPPPTSLSTPSLRVVPEYWLECPASFIELAQVICFTYGNICVSILFSQMIPPLPSPT